jgi:LPXTG-motif cell wall-anchored protein
MDYRMDIAKKRNQIAELNQKHRELTDAQQNEIAALESDIAIAERQNYLEEIAGKPQTGGGSNTAYWLAIGVGAAAIFGLGYWVYKRYFNK